MLRLAQERRKKGLSQAGLARLTGIHPAAISQLESGVAHPWPGWKARLARALEVSGDELFEEVDDAQDA
ncbi:MAG: helix-turn-helix transcriptional regulator [Thermoleophilia bacterium]